MLKAKKCLIYFHLIVRVAGFSLTSPCSIISHHFFSKRVLLLRSTSNSSQSGDRQTNGQHPNCTTKSQTTKPSSSSSRSGTRRRLEARVRFRDADEMIDSLRHNDSVGMLLFTALNCGPCRLQKLEMQQFLQRRKQEKKERAAVVVPLQIFTIETEKWPTLCKRFQVSKLPSMVLLDGDHVVQKLEGLVSAKDLWEHVQKSRSPKA